MFWEWARDILSFSIVFIACCLGITLVVHFLFKVVTGVGGGYTYILGLEIVKEIVTRLRTRLIPQILVPLFWIVIFGGVIGGSVGTLGWAIFHPSNALELLKATVSMMDVAGPLPPHASALFSQLQKWQLIGGEIMSGLFAVGLHLFKRVR